MRLPIALSVVGIGFVTWGVMHHLFTTAPLDILEARVLVLEGVPAFSFAAMLVTFVVPAGYNLLFGRLPAYASMGLFWDFMTFVGSVVVSISVLAQTRLLPDDLTE